MGCQRCGSQASAGRLPARGRCLLARALAPGRQGGRVCPGASPTVPTAQSVTFSATAFTPVLTSTLHLPEPVRQPGPLWLLRSRHPLPRTTRVPSNCRSREMMGPESWVGGRCRGAGTAGRVLTPPRPRRLPRNCTPLSVSVAVRASAVSVSDHEGQKQKNKQKNHKTKNQTKKDVKIQATQKPTKPRCIHHRQVSRARGTAARSPPPGHALPTPAGGAPEGGASVF